MTVPHGLLSLEVSQFQAALFSQFHALHIGNEWGIDVGDTTLLQWNILPILTSSFLRRSCPLRWSHPMKFHLRQR